MPHEMLRPTDTRNMKSIVVTYPDFQSLPKGIKRMLVASESLFFGGAKSASARGDTSRGVRLALGGNHGRFREGMFRLLPRPWGS
jgi:hypothetical protein